MLREMGVRLDGLKFRDTMIDAFLLQTEPQGLKPLSYRHNGMTMHDFSDVAGPYQKEMTIKYIEKALELDVVIQTIVEKVKKAKKPRVKKSKENGQTDTSQASPVDPEGCDIPF